MKRKMEDNASRARYDVRITRKLVVATMALHNFVRKSNIPDPDFEANCEQEGNHQPSLNEEVEVQEDDQMIDSRQYMEGIRDDIAMNLWNNHR
ncbi:F15O4.10 [Arabidopsis thaliana]|uniref:F15O4.10 n=1 Tax=Arabidopsis thaliana TaxID=3702 RepID=Q9LQH5_ARATH|nr:F15O4.10 [Arabidopsis thaliana]